MGFEVKMVSYSRDKINSFFKKIFRTPWNFQWFTRYAAIEIAICLSLAIAFFFLGRHLFDQSIPSQGDVRAHVFKIEIFQYYLSHFSWPQWIPYWYQGTPINQYYPPGFYFIGALLTFIVKYAVISYKLLLLFSLVLNGFAIFYFARRFLKFDARVAIWCLIAYETAAPLLVDFTYGEGPNLLSWGICLYFLTVYLSQAMENQTWRFSRILLPGFLLGIVILIHPFPAIFAVIAVCLFHIIRLLHSRSLKTFLQIELPYLAGTLGLAAVIGMYYWLPAFLTLDYSSGIHSFVEYAWPGGGVFLLILFFLALTGGIIARVKTDTQLKLDFLLICLFIGVFLGFGGTDYLPFNLGDMVQSFRFATMVLPFFAILLITFPMNYQFTHPGLRQIIAAFIIGGLIIVLAAGVADRQTLISIFQIISLTNIMALSRIVFSQFSNTVPGLITSILLPAVLLISLAFLISGKAQQMVKNNAAFVFAGGACLVMLTSFIPVLSTSQQFHVDNIYAYVDNYQVTDYAQILDSIRNERLVVPLDKGGLMEGDSFVTFGWRWGVQTINGPYNQGDPKFFRFTVHLEWENRWLENSITRQNLMQESGAKFIFLRDRNWPLEDSSGLVTNTSNPFGDLMELNQNVYPAMKVTPILMDVDNPTRITEFFNILMPEGFKMVLVDVNEVDPDLVNQFDNVILEDTARASKYPGRNILLLNDTTDLEMSRDQNITSFSVPYLTYTNTLFYHGDQSDDYMWKVFDMRQDARLDQNQQNMMARVNTLMAQYLNKLDYTQTDYKESEKQIEIANSPGFTLIKNSFFPYWQTAQGSLMPTSQGFMLIYTDNSNITLSYRNPGYYFIAAAFSILGIITLGTILLFRASRKLLRPHDALTKL